MEKIQIGSINKDIEETFKPATRMDKLLCRMLSVMEEMNGKLDRLLPDENFNLDDDFEDIS